MIIYKKNLYHIKKLQKKAYNKAIKPKSYIPGNKVWLNNRYIKTKQNCKLEAKFFGIFQVFYLVKNQADKLKLPKKWKIYNVFHILLLEHNITKKKRVDEITS